MRRKFTLRLSTLSDLVIERIDQVVPNAEGFTQLEDRSINAVAISTAGSARTLDLTIGAAMHQADFALFEEYLYEQDENGQRGNISLRNEYTPVNARWSTTNSRTQFGGAQTTHGEIAQYFVEYPILLSVPSDYWEPINENSMGLWYNVQFTTVEI